MAKNPRRALDASNTSIVDGRKAGKGLSAAVITAKAPFLHSFTVKKPLKRKVNIHGFLLNFQVKAVTGSK